MKWRHDTDHPGMQKAKLAPAKLSELSAQALWPTVGHQKRDSGEEDKDKQYVYRSLQSGAACGRKWRA